MATRSLNVVIAGDAKPLGIASKQAEGHIKGVESAGKHMGEVLALGFAAAGAAATGALVLGLKKSVDAAEEAQVSQAKLKAQLQASGISYRAHAKEIDAVIQKHSRLAGVDDEDLQDAFTGLVRSTGSVSKSMHDMGLVTDIARGKHIDVTKAADLLGKVHAGNTAVLKRYGIAFDPVTKAQDKLKDSNVKATAEQVKAAKAADKTASSQKAIAELQKRFGGQAEAYGKTAAGASDRFHVALENVEEKLGKGLLPILAKVTGGVADFLAGIDSGTGAGGRFAAGVSTAFNTVKTVVGNVIRTVRGYLAAHREDIQSVIRAFEKVAQFAQTTWQETLLPIVRRTVGAIKPIVQGVADLIRGIVRTVSGLLSGNWSKAWSGAKEAVSGAWKAIKAAVVTGAENLWEIVKDLGPKLVQLILKGIVNLNKALAVGLFDGIKAAAKALPGLAADALTGIGRAIVSGVASGLSNLGHTILNQLQGAWKWVTSHLKLPEIKLPFGLKIGGDGLGMPGGTAFSGGNSLMGARSSMGPVAGIAARFGLHTSSGLRPGAITTSGNVSYHSTGEALDEADGTSGPSPAKMGFFNFMKNTMGGRLAELIYGPGKVGIKDGQPHNFGPALNAQHMDHVHVAIDSGAPGVGDGLGRSRGDEMGWLTQQWKKVAPVFGLNPGVRPLPSLFKHIRLTGANPFVGVASDPGARGHGTDDLLWPSWLWRSGSGQKALDDTTKLKLFIHEMAHRFQDKRATGAEWKSEGGAEAFARLAMGRFFGGLPAGENSGDPYNGFVTHVMRDLGTPWVLSTQFGRKTGDGIGSLRNGPKSPMSATQVAALAESVGLPGVTFAQIARGESGYDPDNVGHDPGGTVGLGLWQITTKYNDDIIAKYGGVQAMFDPHKNALAARDIWHRQGKAAWNGTRYVTGWDLHYKGGSGGPGRRGRAGPASRVRSAPKTRPTRRPSPNPLTASPAAPSRPRARAPALRSSARARPRTPTAAAWTPPSFSARRPATTRRSCSRDQQGDQAQDRAPEEDPQGAQAAPDRRDTLPARAGGDAARRRAPRPARPRRQPRQVDQRGGAGHVDPSTGLASAARSSGTASPDVVSRPAPEWSTRTNGERGSPHHRRSRRQRRRHVRDALLRRAGPAAAAGLDRRRRQRGAAAHAQPAAREPQAHGQDQRHPPVHDGPRARQAAVDPRQAPEGVEVHGRDHGHVGAGDGH
jgi:hypothetical protein